MPNAQLTENALVLPETVGFKAEAVDEEGLWRPCTVKDVIRDRSFRLTAGMQSGIAAYVPHEIRNRTVPDRKRKKKGHQR